MSDELSIPSRGDSCEQFRQVLIAHGGPAFLRRAAEVDAAYQRLVDACRQQRKQLSTMVGLRLAMLLAQAGSWEVLEVLLEDESKVRVLRELYSELAPHLRHKPPPTQSMPMQGRALVQLIESIENFNRRWLNHLRSIDFSSLNKLRDGYNRFYVLEKECAVRSGTLARKGFHPLEMLEWRHLLPLFPPLPTLRVKAEGKK